MNPLATPGSSDVSLDAGEPPREEQTNVMPSSGSRWQRLSKSFVAAYYLSVYSAVVGPVRLSLEAVDNSTSEIWTVSSYGALQKALNSQPVDELQDGMTLHLGAELTRIVKDLGDVSFAELAEITLRGEAHPEVLSHALRWIGRMADPDSFQQRLLVLARALEAQSPVVRDGAGLGLVELGSPAATPALDAAIGREVNPALRQDLEQAATYLRTKA